MKSGFIIIGTVILIVVLFYLFKRLSGSKSPVWAAQQIRLDQLESVLAELAAGNLEYDFFGITSNGTDCIYFVNEGGLINIEFEVMTDEQKPFVDAFLKFGSEHGFRVNEITHGNKPRYTDRSEAPVYVLLTNSDAGTAAGTGKKIMTRIFSCDETTLFDVVP